MTSLGRPFEVESKRKGISLHLLAKELDLTFYSSRSVRGEWNEKERWKQGILWCRDWWLVSFNIPLGKQLRSFPIRKHSKPYHCWKEGWLLFDCFKGIAFRLSASLGNSNIPRASLLFFFGLRLSFILLLGPSKESTGGPITRHLVAPLSSFWGLRLSSSLYQAMAVVGSLNYVHPSPSHNQHERGIFSHNKRHVYLELSEGWSVRLVKSQSKESSLWAKTIDRRN